MRKATQFLHGGYSRRHPRLTWMFSLMRVCYWSITNRNEYGSYWDADRDQRRPLYGPIWRKGAIRLVWGPDNGPYRPLAVEWSLPATLTGLFFHWTDEGEMSLGFCLGIGIWFSLGGLPRPRPYLDYGETHYKSYERDLHISWHDGGLWWNLWRDDGQWSRAVPKWRHGSVNLVDCLLGRSKFSERMLRTERASIPLPEGSTSATFTFSEFTYKRPRWPARYIIHCRIKPDHPAVVPGKGENAWDLDDSAILEMGCVASDVPTAIAAYLKSVLRDRERYGGSVAWQPEAV